MPAPSVLSALTTGAASPHVFGAAAPSIAQLKATCASLRTAVPPRVALARALLAAGRAAEAVIPCEEAVALAPNSFPALDIRQAVMRALEQGDPHLVKLELAAALNPTNANAQLDLGETYATLERPLDAERHLKIALNLGLVCEANADLSALYLTSGRLDDAERHAKAVLDAAGETGPPTAVAMAYQTLAGIFASRGEADLSARHLDLAYARQSLFRQPAPGCAFTTLVLVTRGNGNLPYKSLLPPAQFDFAVWYMEHAGPEQVAALPPHAVVLNAIGDPDAAMASASNVADFLLVCRRPVINPPDRVQATARDRLGATLAELPGVVIPTTILVKADDIAAGRLPAILAERDCALPVLVRPTGSHGGEGLARIDDEADLARVAEAGGGDQYLTRFCDYRSADGYYRKYRAIFIAGRPYPYHLAISRYWMVHHRSAEMADDPQRIAEELRFLSDPDAAIGSAAMTAVAAIGERLGLDYGGVDFTVTAEGEVLVFEANATMLTHLEAADGPFAAKNRFVQRIIDAFQAHLRALAAA